MKIYCLTIMCTATLAVVLSILMIFTSTRTYINPESGLYASQLEQYLSFFTYKDNQMKLYKESKLAFPSETELKDKWEDFRSTQIKVQQKLSATSIANWSTSFIIFLALFGIHFFALNKQRK